MSTLEITGYQRDTQGIYINKDPNARLTYTFEWADWLPAGTALSAVSYSLQVRANDPTPLVNHSSGISGTKTFITLSGGGAGKVYTVTAQITLNNGNIDRRNFRVRVENRSA
jgi:uncharacterized protein YndB with AHSA1/START domain